MNTAIFLLALVAVSLGTHLNNRPTFPGQFLRRIDVLRQTSGAMESNDASSEMNDSEDQDDVDSHDSNNGGSYRPSTGLRPGNPRPGNGRPAGPTRPPTHRYSDTELFTFPGSRFVKELLVAELMAPLPTDPSILGVTSEPKLEAIEETMFDLHEKFGEWTGIPSMVTMKMTEWLVGNKFSCPILVFDKLFINWIEETLISVFTDMRTTFYDNIQPAIQEMFPGMDEDWYTSVASSVSDSVIQWTKDELRDNFLAQPLMDVAVFSHKFYEGLIKAINSGEAEAGLLQKVMDNALPTTEFKCETPTDSTLSFRTSMKILLLKTKIQGTKYGIDQLEQFFMDQLPMGQRVGVNFDEDKLRKIANVVEDYIRAFLKVIGEYEKVTEMKSDLGEFFIQIFGDKYSNFITVLMEKLNEAEKEESRDIMPSKRRIRYDFTKESRDIMPSKRRIWYDVTEESRDNMPSKRRIWYDVTEESRGIMPSKRRYYG